MGNILILGGDSDAAATQVAAAFTDVFGVGPSRQAGVMGAGQTTRGFVEAALIVLALPPAILGTRDILERSRPKELLDKLIAKVSVVRKATKSTVLIDPGDGKHIPLEEAGRDAILAALAEVEKKLRN